MDLLENLDGLVGTFTISFKMKFLQPMQTTDVWVQATDRSGNFFKVALPLTLKISGNEPLLFESKIHQKVLSFFDESMLFTNWFLIGLELHKMFQNLQQFLEFQMNSYLHGLQTWQFGYLKIKLH